jgi:FkbM family methyltransferase
MVATNPMPNRRDGILGLLRRCLPPGARARLRRNPLANWVLARRYGGIQSVPHPRSPFTFYFDGMRNIGWATGASVDVEGTEMAYAAQRFAKAGKWRCAWDVGANVGSWALFLAGLKPPIEQIICFEPDQTNRKLLELNLERNAISRVRVMPIALSSESGSGTFMSDPITGSTGSLEQGESFIGKYYGQQSVATTVTLKTVDELIAEGLAAPDFLKIDVEGHEWSVLQGARQMLARHRPILMIEVTAHAAEIGALLAELNYVLADPASGNEMPAPAFATAALPAESVVRQGSGFC